MTIGTIMASGKAYAVNESQAVSETLEGEAIIINIETGSYYSLNPAGTAVWELVVARAPVASMAPALAARFDAAGDALERAVASFLDALAAEGLIAEAEAAAEPPAAVPAATRAPFEAPRFQKYDDMREMLLADPIHDVDDMGWPKLK